MPVEIVRCNLCKSTLGHIEDGGVFRFKRRDSVVEVEDAKRITITCYQCGKPNTLYNNPKNDIQDLTG